MKMMFLNRDRLLSFWLFLIATALLLASQGGGVNADHSFICEGTDCLPNGYCDSNTLHCICNPGYFGETCKRQSCPLQCQNGGKCTPKNGSGENGDAICQCATGFFGPTCQFQGTCGITCQNGGICLVTADEHAGLEREYGCQCEWGYTGALCQTLVGTPNQSSISKNSDNKEDKQGVVVAVIVLVILAALLGLTFWIVRRKQQKAAAASAASAGNDLDLQQDDNANQPAEAVGNDIELEDLDDDTKSLPSIA